MTTPASGKKYYKGRLYQHGKTFPYVVWDGVRAYENIPPPELCDEAHLCGPTVSIAQIGKKPHNLRETLIALIETRRQRRVVGTGPCNLSGDRRRDESAGRHADAVTVT